MNTNQLLNILKCMCKKKKVVYNVIPSDYLVNYSETVYPFALIVNSKDSSHPGEHWLAIFSQNRVVDFFCSYGMGIEFYGRHFERFAKNKLIRQNCIPLQGPGSNVCGKYALYFISKLLKGEKLSNVYCGFSKNRKKNDVIVNKFVSRHKSKECEGMPICKIQTSINCVSKN